MEQSPIKLPFKFVFELTTLVSKLIAELATAHSIVASSENMYEVGKQIAAIGLTICASSKHADRTQTLKDMTEINDGVSKSVAALQEHLFTETQTKKVVDKNIN